MDLYEQGDLAELREHVHEDAEIQVVLRLVTYFVLLTAEMSSVYWRPLRRTGRHAGRAATSLPWRPAPAAD